MQRWLPLYYCTNMIGTGTANCVCFQNETVLRDTITCIHGTLSEVWIQCHFLVVILLRWHGKLLLLVCLAEMIVEYGSTVLTKLNLTSFVKIDQSSQAKTKTGWSQEKIAQNLQTKIQNNAMRTLHKWEIISWMPLPWLLHFSQDRWKRFSLLKLTLKIGPSVQISNRRTCAEEYDRPSMA